MVLPVLIPLAFQLLQAYQPGSVTYQAPQNIVPLTTPTPSSIISQTEKQITIGVIGDSMIETLGSDMPLLQKSLLSYFPQTKFRLLNFGASSTTIEQVKDRLSQLISQQPDIIVIESFAYNNFGNTQSGYDRQWQALSTLNTQIKQQLPQTKIILATTIAPNSVVFANGIANLNLSALDKVERTKTIKLYLQNIVHFASSEKIPLADTYHLTLDHQGEGLLEAISSTDHLHPSDYGKQIFADTLADTIAKNQLIK